MDSNFDSHRQSLNGNLCQQLLERERTEKYAPHTFSANLYRQRYRLAKNLFKTDLCGHYGCVNAIEFSNGGKYLASGGDDKRVLIWDVEKAVAGVGQPRVLDTEHLSNIFCLGFDRHNRNVFSGGNDDLVIVHDFETGEPSNLFRHDNPVYGLSIDPQCDSIFATACEDGQILVFDQRVDPAEPLVLAQLQYSSFHAVEFHPAGGNFLVTANSKRGAAFWDLRKPHKPLIQYGHINEESSYMSVRFSTNGKLILALRRRLPPILYSTQSPEPICTFYNNKYYNSCTMKGCTFAGEDDEFVLSGSDDFNLYVWRISDVDLERTNQWIETTQMVLYGHRSIVNQVRYNRQKCLLASSGVEKIIKLWSPFAQKNWHGSLLQSANCSENPRELYSPYNFNSISTPPHSWGNMSHDYSSCNTGEDPRMMAFFDSLIQQEIEGWESENSSTESLSPYDLAGGGGGGEDNEEDNGSSDSNSSTNADDQDHNSSESSENRNDENGPGVMHRRYWTQHQAAARRKERKRIVKRMKQTNRERNKHPNRIAYLIATKRSRLRRLAIKGATLSNRCLCKVVKAPNRRSQTPSQSASGGSAAHKRFTNDSSATTSAAAAAAATATATTTATATSSTGQRNNSIHKYKRRHVYLKTCEITSSSSGSSDDEKQTLTTSNVKTHETRTSVNSALPNHNENVVASTSNGITSNSMATHFPRLQHQQQNEQRCELKRQKLMAARGNDGDESDVIGDTDHSGLEQLQLHVKKPNRINGKSNSTARPAASGSANTTMLPQTTITNNSNTNNNNNNINNRNSNANNDDDNDESQRCSSSNSDYQLQQQQQQLQQQQYATPIKRRKVMEEISETNASYEEQQTIQNSESAQCISNNNSILCTPDSGISMSSTAPASPVNVYDSVASSCSYTATINTNSNSNNCAMSSHCGDGVDSSSAGGSGGGGGGSAGVVVNDDGGDDTVVDPIRNGQKTYMSAFQQKVAQVRRNYRKRFAEDDSNSD